uniref:Small ribosomal subunit protein bS18c n=1 Tax=Dichotomosiphon tuberosus TaxID=118263 RepID=A0A386AWQ0_9CHLO|nr:ribosomal protein S18 [Dichotomosiphon tuberosus]
MKIFAYKRSRKKPLIIKKQQFIKSPINYKNIILLRKYINIEGKIISRRITKITNKQQHSISKAIKQARIMNLLPFVRLLK